MQGGEDRLELTLGVLWSETCWNSWKLIDKAKEAAQELGTGQLVQFQGLGFVVEPRGRASYTWILGYGGVTFFLNRSKEPAGEYGNARAEIGSMALMQYGPERCMKVVRLFLKRLGGVVVWDKLSRVDACVDVVGDDCLSLVQAYLEKRRVCRARQFHVFYEDTKTGVRANGIMIGRGDITCRIYDKVRELEVHRNGAGEKRDWLVQHRWGGEQPRNAWRIEFQVRTLPLRELGVTSFDDWISKRAQVVQYLCNDWLRFTDERPTGGNQKREPLSALWQAVCEAFVSWAGLPMQAIKRAYRVACAAKVDLDRRVKTAVSCLIGVGVEETGGRVSPCGIDSVVLQLVEMAMGRYNYAEAWVKAQKKQSKRGFGLPRCFGQLEFSPDIPPGGQASWLANFQEDTIPF